jgi:3-isopropylmalate/(R)-2-methylmalate dehydratase small subunit
MSKPTVLRGRAWVVRDENGAPIDSIDTDMIFHNAHLALTDVAQMGQHAFGNLPDWKDFPRRALRGDVVVVAENFGCGSSRQQAVDCFASLGIALIIGESFGAIYERNAINQGFPILAADLVGTDLADGQEIEVDLATGRIRLASGREIAGAPLSPVQMEIYQRGGLLKAR